MRTAKLVRFSWAQTKSAFRLPVWNALLVSLTLAIIIASLLAAVGNRLERSLSQQTSELLGADLVVSSTMPISPERIAGIEANGFTTSLVTQFPTMLEAGDQLQMVSLRAVTNPYPLRGKIVTQQDKQSPIPNTGEIWVDASVTERMGVSLGDKLYAGYAELTISNVIESAPDRGRGFSTLNPQAIINQADLEETGLLGLGSRVRYRVLVSGEPNQVTAYAKQLETQLEHAERLRYANRTEGVASGALSNTSRYLRLGALIALLLSVFSIALSLRRFTESRNQRSAVLLSLGFSARQLQQLFSLQMLWAWLACSILASAIALGLEIATFTALSGVLPKPLPPINPWAYLTGPLLGFVTLFTLGLAPLAALSKVSVMQLFRKIQPPTQWVERALQGVALVAIAGVLAIYLGNIPLALLFLGGTLIAAGFIGWLGAWLLQLLATRLAKHKGLGRLLRSRLHQQRRWHRLQIPVMSLLLALIAVLVWARADLVDRWQNQLPTNTPNYFVINIQPSQIEGVRSLLDENAITAQLYPMVRGRITGKNGLEIEEAFTPEQQRDNSLHRELNLTWTDQLPEQTDIIEGQWPTTHNKVEVSV
ncbi:MAG: ABC transporter permease, partial [Pontibacterium sp.]